MSHRVHDAVDPCCNGSRLRLLIIFIIFIICQSIPTVGIIDFPGGVGAKFHFWCILVLVTRILTTILLLLVSLPFGNIANLVQMCIPLFSGPLVPNFRRYSCAITIVAIVAIVAVLMCHIGVAVGIAFVVLASVVLGL